MSMVVAHMCTLVVEVVVGILALVVGKVVDTVEVVGMVGQRMALVLDMVLVHRLVVVEHKLER